MCYNEKDSRYVAVRMAKGGGTREVPLPLESTSEEVIEAMKGIFFLDRSSVFGNTDRMTFTVDARKLIMTTSRWSSILLSTN